MKVGLTVHLEFPSTNFSCISVLSIYVMLPGLTHPAEQERISTVDVEQKNIVNTVLLKITLLRTGCF